MHETGFTQSVIKSEELRLSGAKHDDDDDDDSMEDLSFQHKVMPCNENMHWVLGAVWFSVLT